jgi:hypothetical protein
MRGIEKEADFIEAKERFVKKFTKECSDESDCSWSFFKQAFLNFSKNRCPICEDTLNRYDDIDHYRPKKAGYEFLRCCCDNYMIMCSDCNRTHKKTSFPLDSDFVAIDKSLIAQERPLLINPRVDNLFEYFENHYEHLIDLAKARKKGKGLFLKELKEKPKRAEYGFVKFIAREQFEIVE